MPNAQLPFASVPTVISWYPNSQFPDPCIPPTLNQRTLPFKLIYALSTAFFCIVAVPVVMNRNSAWTLKYAPFETGDAE